MEMAQDCGLALEIEDLEILKCTLTSKSQRSYRERENFMRPDGFIIASLWEKLQFCDEFGVPRCTANIVNKLVYVIVYPRSDSPPIQACDQFLGRRMEVFACQCTSKKSGCTVVSEQNVDDMQPNLPRKPRFWAPTRSNGMSGGIGVVMGQIRRDVCDSTG